MGRLDASISLGNCSGSRSSSGRGAGSLGGGRRVRREAARASLLPPDESGDERRDDLIALGVKTLYRVTLESRTETQPPSQGQYPQNEEGSWNYKY